MSLSFNISVIDNCLLRSTPKIEAPTLILLPGFADNGTMFLPLFKTELATKFNLVAVDLPGTGCSPANSHVRSIDEYAHFIADLLPQLEADEIGLVGHSIASAICADLTDYTEISGFFSIEGNLTMSDAYFTGRAAIYNSAEEFWTAQRMAAKTLGLENPVLQRYYAAASFADPEAMWRLGRDAAARSMGDGLGQSFLQAHCNTHYFWSEENTPEETVTYIQQNNIENSNFTGSHWPTIDSTEETANAIEEFFDMCF